MAEIKYDRWCAFEIPLVGARVCSYKNRTTFDCLQNRIDLIANPSNLEYG